MTSYATPLTETCFGIFANKSMVKGTLLKQSVGDMNG
jgi:hypothetical protein